MARRFQHLLSLSGLYARPEMSVPLLISGEIAIRVIPDPSASVNKISNLASPVVSAG